MNKNPKKVRNSDIVLEFSERIGVFTVWRKGIRMAYIHQIHNLLELKNYWSLKFCDGLYDLSFNDQMTVRGFICSHVVMFNKTNHLLACPN